MNATPQFTAALLKVASRCNLDCDYCYVYKHADQSWRAQPRLMSDETIRQFAHRLRDYLTLQNISEFSITFHGGEPLLFGSQRLRRSAQVIREIVGANRVLKFSIQTNGTLLTDEAIAELELSDITISLSLDGPKEVNDRHRVDHGGQSTFDPVFAAVGRLNKRRSSVFCGVIAVIDPEISPRQLFEFFDSLDIPRLDLLLPDATHERLPLGRGELQTRYSSWLNEAFFLWFTEFSALPLRWFDSLLASRLGVPSPTDAMGLGAVSLIVIDTDGSYTDHDVFKITAPQGGALQCNVADTSFEEVSRHPTLAEHSFRLTLAGLANECKTCPVVEACGGGSVMHRWSGTRGLAAPSVYCGEIFSVLETATRLLKQSLVKTQSVLATELISLNSNGALVNECQRWRRSTETRATEAAKRIGIERNGESAAAVLLAELHGEVKDCQLPEELEHSGRWLNSILLHSGDPRLVIPFSDSIRLLPPKSREVKHGIESLASVGKLINTFKPHLLDAFASLISDILFVESTVESRDRIFSFSDDSAPNILYIAPYVGNTPLEADDLGDSLLHEFLHQLLYQMERDGPMLLDHVYPRFPAPWREGLRPAGGFFHGTFVFAGLAQYWSALAQVKTDDGYSIKATENARRFTDQAAYGISSLEQFALLTPRGEELLRQLRDSLGLGKAQMRAPGVLPIPAIGS